MKFLASSRNRVHVKTYQLDSFPGTVIILPLITSVVNMSLQSGKFPAKLKEALITPLLKKTNLDVEELKNFRPVSNLPFVGKSHRARRN